MPGKLHLAAPFLHQSREDKGIFILAKQLADCPLKRH